MRGSGCEFMHILLSGRLGDNMSLGGKAREETRYLISTSMLHILPDDNITSASRFKGAAKYYSLLIIYLAY